MKELADGARTYAARSVGLLAVCALYVSARQPALTAHDRQDLASGFRFTRSELPELSVPSTRVVRPVHPRLRHLDGWISAVGAAIALADVDGDGLANDACSVDTRTDTVVVTPVTPRDGGFAPFALFPRGIPYDAATTAPMGCLPGDLNEDGLTDLLVYYWGRRPVLFLQSPGAALSHGSFRPQEIAPAGAPWFTNAATLADADGDGHLDVVIGNYFPDGARVLEADAPADAPAQEMQESMSRSRNGGGHRLLLCRPRQRLVACEERADAFGPDVAGGWTLAVGAADLDGDLLPEIYLANDFGSDRLLHNRSSAGQPRFAALTGTRHLTTPRSKVLGDDSYKGMGVDFGDVDGDGTLDIYVSNIAAPFALEESHFLFIGTGDVAAMWRGRAPYEDRSEPLGLARSGWGWDARLADFDNDGLLEAVQACGFMAGDVDRWPQLHELAMGNDQLLHRPEVWPRFQPGDDLSGQIDNAFFVRDRRGVFRDLAADVGLREPAVTRGIATADVDGDGDLDLAFANQWAASAFYRNDTPRTNASLVLRLLAPGQGGGVRPAIGATAVVFVPHPSGPGGVPTRPAAIVSQVDGGNGHSGKRSAELHYGLGVWPRTEPLRVDLSWRDGQGHVQRTVRRLPPGRHTLVLDDAGGS